MSRFLDRSPRLMMAALGSSTDSGCAGIRAFETARKFERFAGSERNQDSTARTAIRRYKPGTRFGHNHAVSAAGQGASRSRSLRTSHRLNLAAELYPWRLESNLC